TSPRCCLCLSTVLYPLTSSPIFSYPPLTSPILLFFFFNDTAPTEIYTLSLHDALPISRRGAAPPPIPGARRSSATTSNTWPLPRSEEHTSELQSLTNLVCRLLLEKKKKKSKHKHT